MNSLNNLTTRLREHPLVIEYNKLDNIINQNETIKESIKKLKQLQKQYVKTNSNEDKALYLAHKEHLMSYPIFIRYLEIIEEIEELLINIQTTIEYEINDHN